MVRAPMRSACLSWPFIERPACSISTRMPSPRSRAPARTPSSPVSGFGQRDVDALARRPAPRSSEASRMRSMPAAQPTPGRGRAAELLDQAVVAPAAADAGLRARAAATRARTPCACSSRGRARASESTSYSSPAASSSARTSAKCSASSARRGGRAAAAPRSSPPACPRGRRRTRAAGSGRAARAPPRESSLLVRAQVARAARRGTRARVSGVPRLDEPHARRAARPRARGARASSRISSASMLGSSEPSASAPTCVNWRKRPACGASWRKNGPQVQSFTGWGSLCIPCSM